MVAKEYDWTGNATLHRHSLAKHDVLRTYLTRYVEIVAANPRMDSLRLSFVDGFSGGGQYLLEGTSEKVYGSPIIFLETAREVEARINAGRTKPFKLETEFFFVDSNKEAIAALQTTLTEKGYAARIGRDIFLLHDEFQNIAPKIIERIGKRGRANRAIFLLDQYGYSSVPFSLLNELFGKLPNAEVLLTFAVESLLDYFADTPGFRKIVDGLGISSHFDWNKINQIRRSDKYWKFLIQAELYKAFIYCAGARFFTPFFIRSLESHRSYWFVHLSMHARARDEMARLHWLKHNHFAHYGGAGLNMLGYDPEQDPDWLGNEFLFDNEARERSVLALKEQLPEIIFERGDMTFGDLLQGTCNTTPATAELYRVVLGELLDSHDIDVVSQSGTQRRVGGRIASGDIIRPSRQIRLI